MLLLRAFAVTVIFSSAAFAQTQRDAITREAQRLSEQLKQIKDDDPDWKDSKPLIATYVEQAQANAAAGRAYRALEVLAEAEGIYIATNTMALSKKEGKTDIP